jgi:plastocyanin
LALFAFIFFLIAGLMIYLLTQYSERKTQEKQLTVTIVASDYAFSPNSITIERGKSIKFIVINKGLYPHNLVLKHDKKLAELIQLLEPNSKTEITYLFSEGGVYEFLCTIAYPAPVPHYELGMKGIIVVR